MNKLRPGDKFNQLEYADTIRPQKLKNRVSLEEAVYFSSRENWKKISTIMYSEKIEAFLDIIGDYDPDFEVNIDNAKKVMLAKIHIQHKFISARDMSRFYWGYFLTYYGRNWTKQLMIDIEGYLTHYGILDEKLDNKNMENCTTIIALFLEHKGLL